LLEAVAARLPLAVSMAIVGVFALFHGLAHGAEMPAGATGLDYGAGFVLATLALHLAGVGLGLFSARKSSLIAQTTGAAIALTGAAMLVIGG
jgi:urease accessory protein